MKNTLSVRYLKHNQIDIGKWDRCISHSPNGQVFGYSWYLDIVSENWDALVVADYEIIMPLTTGIKLNNQYIVQPFMAPRLGVFSSTAMNEKIVQDFVSAIPDKYKYIEIHLNKYNKIVSGQYVTELKTAFSLDLIYSYDKLFRKFTPEIKHALEQAAFLRYTISKGLIPVDFVQFMQNSGVMIDKWQSDAIKNIVTFALNHKFGQVLCAYDHSGLIGVAFFAISSYNIHLLIITSKDESLNNLVVPFLIDGFIKQNCEKNLTLTFENTNNEIFNTIFKGFHANEYNYQVIKKNKAPAFFSFLKKIIN